MTELALIDANICWTPASGDSEQTAAARYPELQGKVRVEDRLEADETSLYHKHRVKLGACMMWKHWTAEERLIELFRYVQLMTARDGLAPAEVHRELMKIQEYREMLASYTGLTAKA